jgi:GNAT superfamily N-acetyltransferase
MLVTDMPPAALQALAVAAKAQGLHRFNGPNTRRLAELVAGGAEIHMPRASGLHRLRRVVPPEDVPGHPRLAEPADTPQAFEWVKDFQADVHDEQPPLTMSYMEARIADGGLWLWEHDGRPLSMAAWTKPIHGVVRINLVYTPPEARGHGYASALVAAVSQIILDQGHIPILYTDLANPTSNKIYAAVGFEKLEEPQLWEILSPVPEKAVEAVNSPAAR